MTDDETAPNPIKCPDCGSIAELHETPYRDDEQYVVTCECDGSEVDVSDAVSSSSLTEPITGKWSNIDHNTRVMSNDDVGE